MQDLPTHCPTVVVVVVVVLVAEAPLAGLPAVLVQIAMFPPTILMALVVVGLSIAGLVVLMRDWRGEGSRLEEDSGPPPFEEFDIDTSRSPLKPDEFSPDISTDPNGPSSNARAD